MGALRVGEGYTERHVVMGAAAGPLGSQPGFSVTARSLLNSASS